MSQQSQNLGQQQVRAIPRALENLDTEIARSFKVLSDLTDRLQPVLREAQTVPAEDPASPAGCSLQAQLDGLSRRANELARNIMALEDRVEL